MKQRIFVDMDGTIAYWEAGASYEEVCTAGYFLNLEPVHCMINAIRYLIRNEYDVYVLSAVIDKNREREKRAWLRMYLPEVKKENYIFVPCGENKADYISDKCENDILLDDYSENLHGWHGIGIKVMNGINGTKGTWNGMKIHGYMSTRQIVSELKECIQG